MEEKKNEIILFENQGVKLEVNLKDETVWLNREQLEKQGKILVIRPSKLVNIKRIEKNIDTLQEMYDLGKNDTIKLLDKIRMKGW